MARRIRMRDRSIISPLECLTGHLLLGILIGCFYMDWIFLPIGSLSVKASRVCFYALLIGFSLLGTIVRWRKCMSVKATVADSLVGTGFYTMLAYYPYYKFAMAASVITIFIHIYYNLELFSYENPGGRRFSTLPEKMKRSYIFRRRAVRLYHSLSMYIAFLAVCLTIPVCRLHLKYGSQFKAYAYRETPVAGFDMNYKKSPDSLSNRFDTISKIRFDDMWEPLTVKEKLEVVQAVCDCERNYWGIDYPIHVETGDLNGNTLGQYNDMEKKVVLDSLFLGEGEASKVLEVTLHEMYHAWQYRLVRLYLDASESEKTMRVFMYCQEYLREMNDYKHGSDDPEEFMEYYGQYMEKQARAYSESAVFEYYDQMDEIYYQRQEEIYGEAVGGIQ